MVFCVCLQRSRINLSTESLILPNYAPENVLPPSLPSSLRSPCLLHSFGPSSSMRKLLSRQFLRGRHSTNPLHHPGWGGSWIFFARILLLGSSGSQRLGEFLSSLSQSDSCCVFVCVPCRWPSFEERMDMASPSARIPRWGCRLSIQASFAWRRWRVSSPMFLIVQQTCTLDFHPSIHACPIRTESWTQGHRSLVEPLLAVISQMCSLSFKYSQEQERWQCLTVHCSS